jgi:hypothetical protein
MKYALEIGSVAMIYISTFINIGSGIQKLLGGIHGQQAEGGNIKSLYGVESIKTLHRGTITSIMMMIMATVIAVVVITVTVS